MPDGTPHPSNSRATIPDDPAPGSASSRNISSTRTAPRWASRRAAFRRRRARTTPASATRTSATSPARWSRSTSTSVSPPASTSRASMPRSPRASGNSRSSARAQRTPPTRCGWPATYPPPRREIRRRHRVALQAARRHRLERLRHALELLDQVHARGRRQGVLREADGGLRRSTRRAHRRLRPGQPPAADRPPRDPVDRQVQLWPGRPRRLGARAAQLRQQRLQGLPRGPPSELAGDPYQIASQILKTIASVPTSGEVSAAA